MRCFALLLLLPVDLFARAGGGGGFHGGGGGGHSSGGGGGGGFHGGGGWGGGGGGGGYVGGGGTPLWLIILIIIIVLVYLYWQNQQRSNGREMPSDEPQGDNPLLNLPTAAAWVADLREHDPAFDQAAFYQRVGVAFDKIQAAWCAQKLDTVRPFISDGVYERFLLQIAEQRDEGYHDHMEGIRVLDLRMVEIESDGIYDEIAVQIRAVSVDYRMSLTTGQRISGSGSPEEFTEIWTFVRRRGAVTKTDQPGLIEGRCPNCGAPIEMNQSANCVQCKALLRSGEYDWVLTEITQQSEWDGVRHRAVPGVEELRSRDPNFNAAEVEDRASVGFWRVATAERLGKIDPLAKIASPELCKTYAAGMRPPPGQQRVFWGDCAVGSARLIGVMSAPDAVRAVVEVCWNGKQFAARPGASPQQVGDEKLFHTLLVFFRRPDAQTEVGKGISSAHCPSCGAPESGGSSSACEFCGAVLTDGAHGWVLQNVYSRLDPQAQGILAALHRSSGPENL